MASWLRKPETSAGQMIWQSFDRRQKIKLLTGSQTIAQGFLWKRKIKMQMHHVEKLSSVKTKSTVSIGSPMWRWSLLKNGYYVWLEVASIFLSLVFKKNTANGKEACQDDQVQVCLLSYLSEESLVFLGQNVSNLCQSIFVVLTVYCDKIFQ